MSIRHTFHGEHMVHVLCEGDVNIGQVLEYEMAIVDDPRFDPTHAELIDMRETTRFDVDPATIREIVGYEEKHVSYIGPRKVAFIAPTDVIFGMLRIYGSLEDDSPMDTNVFRSIQEACTWLGVPVPMRPDPSGEDARKYALALKL